MTEGKPTLTDVVVAEGFDRKSVLAQIAAVEDQSEHPIAEAIVRGARSEGITVPSASGFRSVTGYGVAAMVDGQEVMVGADRYMLREAVDISAFVETERDLAGRGRTALLPPLMAG